MQNSSEGSEQVVWASNPANWTSWNETTSSEAPAPTTPPSSNLTDALQLSSQTDSLSYSMATLTTSTEIPITTSILNEVAAPSSSAVQPLASHEPGGNIARPQLPHFWNSPSFLVGIASAAVGLLCIIIGILIQLRRKSVSSHSRRAVHAISGMDFSDGREHADYWEHTPSHLAMETKEQSAEVTAPPLSAGSHVRRRFDSMSDDCWGNPLPETRFAPSVRKREPDVDSATTSATYSLRPTSEATIYSVAESESNHSHMPCSQR